MGQSWTNRREGRIGGDIEENASLPWESNRRLISLDQDEKAQKSATYSQKGQQTKFKAHALNARLER